MEDIINAMHNKEVAGALLDMYAAATKKSMFGGGDIQLNRMIEYPTGFGFVLSGNMAKAAPLFRKALASKKSQISQIVEENTESISLVSEIVLHGCSIVLLITFNWVVEQTLRNSLSLNGLLLCFFVLAKPFAFSINVNNTVVIKKIVPNKCSNISVTWVISTVNARGVVLLGHCFYP